MPRQPREAYDLSDAEKRHLIDLIYTYPHAGRYTVAVKVIDIFGNDTRWCSCR